ncbi:hypothetical protein RH831_07980 [Halodesulfurarchaeum sp. HSR-GB]|uniref:hypothetical protein n=1 Tax=Halodesulfurarchaeum sp. HSR-GB TaxID=3074077 RepID=UPI00285A4903|nr:hypothetical protein [Halodesulfurarchaeum sp. HSR-GB]MDR5657118.1 hypothetical protein [Halodesulfurarchaeum sp. HSR-GB]
MKRPDCVDEMAPHTQMVFETLAKESPMTQAELLEATRLPFRVGCDAISELTEADLITAEIHAHGRRRLYQVQTTDTRSADEQVVSA